MQDIKQAVKILIGAAFLSAFAISCKESENSDTRTPQQIEDEQNLKNKADSAYYLVGVQLGAYLKGNNFATSSDEIDFERIKKGVCDYLAASGEYGSEQYNAGFEVNPQDLISVCDDYISLRAGLLAERNKQACAEFLEQVSQMEGVVKTDSGLIYEILEHGDSTRIEENGSFWVNYIGTLHDGTEFDACAAGVDSTRFEYKDVIKGWKEGLKLIGAGGHIKLYIPSELGYADRQVDFKILPESALIYDITLKRIENNK